MSSSPYQSAARLLAKIWETHKSIKTLAYGKDGQLQVSKATYAQVCHVLEKQKLLRQVLSSIQPPLQCRNEALLYVLLYELLLGPNRKIRGGGGLKRLLMKREEKLREIVTGLQGDEQQQSSDTRKDGVAGSNQSSTATLSSSAVLFPRYARVNTLKASTAQVLKELIQWNKDQQEKSGNKQKTGHDTFVYADRHVPDLLVLPPKIGLYDHPLVQSGKLILQDKSSCFSALCLARGSPTPLAGDCLDACAAPGNKTSHLAALLSNGTVTALDRSSDRLNLLQRRMKLLVPTPQNDAGANDIDKKHKRKRHSKGDSTSPSTTSKVRTMHHDFLKLSTELPFRGILLDPSCSGSGIFSLDRQGDTMDASRIEHLSNFQLTALKHAMSFSSVRRIVYSTCSLHSQENECVVAEALNVHGKDWQLVAPYCLQDWDRRGQMVDGLDETQANAMIRADRNDDTNGFFVAYLERRSKAGGANDNSNTASTNSNSSSSSTAEISNNTWPPEGITLYDGQFRPERHEFEETKKKALDEKAVGKKAVGKKAVGKKDNDVNSKKRAKKQAWKKKQQAQKEARLLKKQQESKTT